MAKIPFTLGAWLKDKSQKVETRDGRIVHDIWPVKDPLIVNGKRAEVCALIDGEEDAFVFFEGGKYISVNTENPFDLFLVTPEPELSEFEKEYIRLYKEGYTDGQAGSKPISDDNLKECAAELLALAREELFANDAVLKEYAQVSREQGKAAALKDLPRWRNSWDNLRPYKDIAALKAYPEKMGMFHEADIHYEADLNKAARIKYIEGYEQAEKDMIDRIRKQVKQWMPEKDGEEHTYGERMAFNSVLHLLEEMEEE